MYRTGQKEQCRFWILGLDHSHDQVISARASLKYTAQVAGQTGMEVDKKDVYFRILAAGGLDDDSSNLLGDCMVDIDEGAAEAANNLEDEVMADVNTEAEEPADNIEDEAMADVNSEAAPALAPVTPDRLDRDTDLDMDNGTADPGPIGDFAPERGLSVTPTPAGPVQHTSAMELDLASDQVSDYQSSMPGFSREHTWIAQTDTGANTADTTPQPAPSCMF